MHVRKYNMYVVYCMYCMQYVHNRRTLAPQ